MSSISQQVVLELGQMQEPGKRAATVYLGLGSNMSERRRNLDAALKHLSKIIELGKVSSVYDTEPVNNPNQPRFLNLVCEGRTALSPKELLRVAKDIEKMMGREPGERNSPRPIDIDILFYGNRVVQTEELNIPHPRLAERAFVLIPLAQIAPDLVHPISGRTVKELLNGVSGTEGVIKID